MICVVWLEKSERLCGFKIKGHAERGEYGEDLVCAAVSAIVQTCILGFTEVLHISVDYKLDGGGESRCVINGELNAEQAAGAQVLLQTLQKGLESISLSYPRALKL